jgi:hypothetical protein
MTQDNNKIDPNQWLADYENVLANPPEEHDFLLTEDGQPICINIEFTDGQSPFAFGRAYVPDTYGKDPEWYARSIENDSKHGWKAILTHRSRQELLRRYKIPSYNKLPIKKLRVVRKSDSGKALVVEIVEFLDQDDFEIVMAQMDIKYGTQH